MGDQNDSSQVLEMVQQRILALEQMNLEIVDDSTVYSTVRELMALFGARPIGINTSNHVYRIRRNLDERLHSTLNFDWYPPLFSTVSQLWYPPSEGVNSRGRVNLVHESVFYCAESLNTAVLEMRPKPGQYLTLLECSFVEGATPNVFDAGVYEGPRQLNPNYGGGRPEKDTQFQAFLQDQGIKEATELIRTFLVSQFMKVVDQGKEYEYKITNMIARVLLNEFAFVRKDDFTPVQVVADGIVYASIAAEAKAPNVAFTCKAADRLLKPFACCVYFVESLNETGRPILQKSHVAQSLNADGTITW